MKTLKQHINEALKIGNNLSEWSAYSCQPTTKKELIEIIHDRIGREGPNCDLNDIDLYLIDDMSYLFRDSKFNGDISKWNVSNVKCMIAMFAYSKFNRDISKWKINKNCNTWFMFAGCPIKEEYKPKSLQL